MTNITKPLPPLELLQELFKVSADSPSGLIWKISRSPNVKPGQVAGSKNEKGYWRVGVKTDVMKQYRTHRIVYFLQTGADPKTLCIDHIFGIQDNLNLRIATASENGGNRKKTKSFLGQQCSSKFKGVSWHKRDKKWCSHIHVQQKTIYLGYFIDEIEAASAYNKAAIEYFGDFAKLNTFKKPE
jgi:hypothetical protein